MYTKICVFYTFTVFSLNLGVHIRKGDLVTVLRLIGGCFFFWMTCATVPSCYKSTHEMIPRLHHGIQMVAKLVKHLEKDLWFLVFLYGYQPSFTLLLNSSPNSFCVYNFRFSAQKVFHSFMYKSMHVPTHKHLKCPNIDIPNHLAVF